MYSPGPGLGPLNYEDPLPDFTVGESRGMSCPYPSVMVFTGVPCEVWFSKAGPTATTSTAHVFVAANEARELFRPKWASMVNMRAQAAGNIQIAPVVRTQTDVLNSANLYR